MTENSRQPRPDDAVLGGQNDQPINAAVLGGMGGVKHRLKSGDVEQKIAALPETLKYGQAGLELLIQALRDKAWGVRSTAYSLLQENIELALKQGLRVYNPYWLKCFQTIPVSNSISIRSVAFSPDGRTLASGSADSTIKLWKQENSTQFELDPVEFFHRYLVLKEALKSGKTGLELLIQSLNDESLAVGQAVYWLLQESEEPKVKQALQEYFINRSVNTIIDDC